MKQLNVKQIFFLIITFIPVTKLFMMNSIISEYAKNDMWISVIINLFLDFSVLLTALYFYKKTGCTFIEYLKKYTSKLTTNIILSLFAIYFLLKCLVPLFEQKEYVSLTLYISSPRLIYFIPFFFVSFYLCCQKLSSLGRVADLMWPIALIGSLLIISLSLENADFYAFLPINYNNTSGILKGSLYSLNWFGDGCYFLFVIGEFKIEKKDIKRIIIACIIAMMTTLIFSFLFYSIFTSIGYRQRYAFTEVSKYSTVINSTGRFDYIGITFILFINIISTIFPIFFSTRIFSEMFSVKNKTIISLIINSLLVIFMIIFTNSFYTIEQFILKKLSFVLLFIGIVLPALLSIIFGIKGKGDNNEIY